MRVLCVNLPIETGPDFIDCPYFANLGLLQTAAALRGEGRHISVLDAFALAGSDLSALKSGRLWLGAPPGKISVDTGRKPFDTVIVALNPFHRPHSFNPYLKHFLRRLKGLEGQPTLILADCYAGGMHYIDYESASFLNRYPEISHLVRYETESALAGLLGDLDAGSEHPQEILRGSTADTASLPPPAWDLIDTEAYQRFLSASFRKLGRRLPFRSDTRLLPIMATRGCAYSCIFCAHSIPDAPFHPYRKHSLDVLREYFALLKHRYDIRSLVFLDDAPNLDRTHFSGLLNLLNREGMFYDFPNGLRADRIEKEHLDEMSGRVQTLSISAESADPEVLRDIVGKKQAIESVERVAAWCNELRIPLLIHYVIGLPGEDVAQINTTLRHAARMSEEYGAVPSVQYATPLPGTRLQRAWKQAGHLATAETEDFGPAFSKTPLHSSPRMTADMLRTLKTNLKARLDSKRPDKIILNLTYRCNNRCLFCAVGDRPRIDADLVEVRAKLAASAGGGISLLDIDGGEPTLHPGLLEIIEYARSLGYERISVTTNGRRLSRPHFARRLLGTGLTGLLISLHGHTAEIHEAHTGRPRSFDETVQGIRNVLRLRPSHLEFGLNTTVTKFNYLHILAFLRFASELGVGRVNVQFVTPFGRATSDILPPTAEAADLLGSALRSEGHALSVQVVNLPMCYLPGLERVAAADLLKCRRNMVFIPQEEINLGEFLATKRSKTDQCAGCVYDLLCAGVYKFDRLPLEAAESAVSHLRETTGTASLATRAS